MIGRKFRQPAAHQRDILSIRLNAQLQVHLRFEWIQSTLQATARDRWQVRDQSIQGV